MYEKCRALLKLLPFNKGWESQQGTDMFGVFSKRPAGRAICTAVLVLAMFAATAPLRVYGQSTCSSDTSIAPADSITQLVSDDPNPVGTRTPLILIHGINGRDDQTRDGWDVLENYLFSHVTGPGILQTYKIYRFRYDSEQQPVSELGRSLRNQIGNMILINPEFDKPVVIIAHSMGGLVARSMMNEWALTRGVGAGQCGGERVLKLITLATPHHGTPAANGAIRIPATEIDWTRLPIDIDAELWTGHFSCFFCGSDPSHPNRGDLRYDNRALQPSWSASDYAGKEVNSWLLGLPHTYDSKVIAYYGYLGSSADITSLGTDDAPQLFVEFNARALGSFLQGGNDDAVMNVLGVLLQRITSQTFDGFFSPIPITTVYNDGVVPIFSGAFDGAAGVSRFSCSGFNHSQMQRNGSTGNTCTTGLVPFASVVRDLTATVPPANNLLVTPSANWNYGSVTVGGSSDKVFTFKNTGIAAFSLTAFTISGPNAAEFFAQPPPVLPLIIGAGQTQSVAVRFKPAATGTRQATLSVSTDVAVDSAPPIALVGSGTQAACSAALSTSQINLPASGGSGSFQVTAPAGCPWVVSVDPSLVTNLLPAQGLGFGAGTVSFTLPPNSGPLRISKIILSVASATQSVLIIQDGASASCSYQLSSTTNHLPSSGGTGAFTIVSSTGCGWSVSSSQPFVTFSSLTSGSGTAGISYTVAANPNPALRFSTISVTTPAGVLAYTVTEDAASAPPPACSYSLSATARAYTADAWDDAFIVSTTTGCTWTASTTDSWVSLLTSRSPAGGGSDSVGFEVFPNTGTTLRNATISVQGAGQANALVFTIWQQPPSVGSPHIVLPLTTVVIGDVLINSRANQTVQIQNTGPKDLLLSAVFKVSGSADMFVSSFNPAVPAGGTNTFQISFAPGVLGNQSAIFRILSNDPVTPSIDLTVTGNGIPIGQGGTDFNWVNLPAGAPGGLSELAGAAIGNTIYLFGSGIHANSYDPTINQWTALPNLPHVLVDPGVAVINGKLYVIGDLAANQVQIFNPATNSWSLGATLPDTRQSAAVASAGGKLYVMGGILAGNVIGTVLVYDPAANSWSSAADMITPRATESAVTVNGLIYVIGGILNQGIRSGVTEIYDPVANTWSNREDMPTRRSLSAVAALGTDIYVLGGSDNSGSALAVVEKQDTAKVKDNPFLTQTWTEKNPLQHARLRGAAAFVNGKAFVFGGTNSTGEVTVQEQGSLTAAPIAGITSTSASFGDVAVGGIGETAITVENNGNALLTLSYNWSVADSQFRLFRAPVTLAAGQVGVLIVRLVPNSSGAKTNSLIVTTNDTSHASVTISFTGNGVQPAPVVTGRWQIVNSIHLPPSTIPRYLAIAGGIAYVDTPGPGLIGVDLSTGLSKFRTSLTQFPNSFPGLLSANTQRVYVPLSFTGTTGQVAMVDAQSGSVVSYAAAGSQAFATALGQGRVYATDEVRFTDGHPSSVFVLDAQTGGLLNSVPVGFNPNFVALGQSAQRAYVTTFGDEGTPNSGVTVVDTTSNTIIASVPTRYNPRGVALSNGRAYIVTENDLEVMDMASNVIVSRIPLPQDSNGITESLGRVFITNPTLNTVTVIDEASLSVVQTLTPGNSPLGIAADPATHVVYVANQADGTIVALREVQPTFDLSCAPLALSGGAGAGATPCTLTGQNGFSGTVDLSCTNLPGNSSCSFATPEVTVGVAPVTANLSFQSDLSLPPGSYSFTVRGASPGLAREIGIPFAVTPLTTGLLFVPASPCRVADTRNPAGAFGGPFLAGGNTRSFAIPSGLCGIPTSAQAYSLNLTVVPHGSLGFLTAFPCGQSLPLASSLNAIDGRVKAGAAIVPAGPGGAVCMFASNDTDLVIDINGYFVPATTAGALAFYPVSPCRLADTRLATGPLGGPALKGNAERSFPLLSGPCNLPATAQAYSLNYTSVPKGPLGFLTTWPAGTTRPLVSTLNAPTGAITANAAIVPAGTSGDISVFVTNDADLVIDVNGYFAPPAAGGLSLITMMPCRVLDTRNPAGSLPFNGTLNVNVTGSACNPPAAAQAFVLNATVVPPGLLGFLSLWPQGAPQPLVSTLNALDGVVTSNMAIVPANNGSVSAFGSNPTHLVLDISSYFVP